MGKDENEERKDEKLSSDEAARIFGLRTANDWLLEAKRRPIPKMLLGEFWLEGELAIMFADTGKGKSILAVQIAEAITRGNNIGPIKTGSGPQTVLYLDCELTEKQFEMRYAADAEDGDEFLKNHYEFSDNFFRAQIDLSGKVPAGFENFEHYLRESLGQLAAHVSAGVLIVDNISVLQRSNENAGAALTLMRELRRLKNEQGLSILVLAHTPKRVATRPLTLNDLAGFKTLSNFADNVFAIGQSRIESDIRYLKHLKQRSTEMFCDERNVPAFRIVKRGGNFLSFEFLRYTTEAVHLFNYGDKMAFRRVAMVKKLAQAGMSQRGIAAEIGISLGAVNKYLHMECLDQKQVENSVELDPAFKADQFPGCKQIDAGINEKAERLKTSKDYLVQCRAWDGLADLTSQRDAAQIRYWIASGKIDKKAAAIAASKKPIPEPKKPAVSLFRQTHPRPKNLERR